MWFIQTYIIFVLPYWDHLKLNQMEINSLIDLLKNQRASNLYLARTYLHCARQFYGESNINIYCSEFRFAVYFTLPSVPVFEFFLMKMYSVEFYRICRMNVIDLNVSSLTCASVALC